MKNNQQSRKQRSTPPMFLLVTILMIIGSYASKCQSDYKSNNATIKKDEAMKLNKLTKAEERVIIYKGTEPAYTGEYTNNFKKGIYICRQCSAPLYNSESKFHSGCGWPSFDAEIPGAVKSTKDADGERTEITCTKCGAHLGHVFYGEGFTEKNTRNCVNSISLVFQEADTAKVAKAIFAGGCFWGVEFYFQHEKGVISTRVGYTGGHTDNPTYREVCSHTTGHIEAVEITYDPSQTSYEQLAKLFFEIHDPTQTNGQGPDHGEQYYSVVFYTDDAQKQTAQKLITILESKGYKIATQLREARVFWPAEEYHQEYYEKEGATPYCHKRVERFN